MNYLQNFYEDLKPVYLLINNNLCRKLVSSIELPIIFDNNLNVIPLSFFFFLMVILIYLIVNLKTLRLHCHIV